MIEMQLIGVGLYISLLITQGITSLNGSPPYQVRKQTICREQIFEATCPAQGIIIIKEAVYGHLGVSKCIEVDTGHFGCNTSILEPLEHRCSGRNSCIMAENDPVIRALNPCSRGLDVYLDISYICLMATKALPCGSNILGQQSTYVSNLLSSDESCNRENRSWTRFSMASKAGQKILISPLIMSSKHGGEDFSKDVCFIKDGSRERKYSLHVKRKEAMPVMVSESNVVTISILQIDGIHYLLLFEVTGCEDLKPPPGMWVQREGDQSIVRCNHSTRTWKLLCEGDQWHGIIGNCSQSKIDGLVDLPETDNVAYQTTSYFTVTKDIILVIVIVTGLLLALIIVTVGYLCYKRRVDAIEVRHDANGNQTDPDYSKLPEETASVYLALRGNLHVDLPRCIHFWGHADKPETPGRNNQDIMGISDSCRSENVPLRNGFIRI